MSWIIMPHERAMMNAGLKVQLGPSNQEFENHMYAEGRREYIPLQTSKNWCDVDTSPPLRPLHRKTEPDSFDLALYNIEKNKVEENRCRLSNLPDPEPNYRPLRPFTPMREPIYEPPNITESILKYGTFKDPDPDPILDPSIYGVPKPEPMYVPANIWDRIGKNARFSDDD